MLTPSQAKRIFADMRPLSDELRRWREEVRLTPAQAARRCNMSPQHYWQLENGQRGSAIQYATLLKLAAGTGIPLERLGRCAELQRDLASVEATTVA